MYWTKNISILWENSFSNRISRVPPYSRIMVLSINTGLSPSLAYLPRYFSFLHHNHWPIPLSLATTHGVSVDFLSSGYLDVSVPQVRFPRGIPLARWVSPFGHLRINDSSHLPVAFRSVARPSSPLSAKASTKCSYVFLFSIAVGNAE